MSEEVRVVRVVGLSDLAMFLFLAACVVTCGWAPNCNESPACVKDAG